jgi:3',5'-nucleoside bisphosphate phosphatase
VRVDLHTHSTASDGTLSPLQVIQLAAHASIDQIALTDHDTLNGYKALRGIDVPGVRVLAGVELSTTWSGVGIHVVGLNVNPDEMTLGAGIEQQSAARGVRAERIVEILGKAGFSVDLDAVYAIAGGVPGRPHFASYMVEQGFVVDARTAFKRYLGAGRPGDIKTGWASLEAVVAWIHAAGGVATLAHPARYKLSRTKLRRLIDAFASVGGDAIEVISGRQHSDVTAHLAALAKTCGLLASCGSDFHTPGCAWATIGMPLSLPEQCEPVWQRW